uniref:Ras-GEF domain-containing protein n=1 Tax=Steinernema glaseri TaxID=37863 RepID=A0A1I8A2C1_9BILA
MDRIPLDFVERVVNLLSYDNFLNTSDDIYHSYGNPEEHKAYADTKSRERHAASFSRLSQPWPQVAASLKECFIKNMSFRSGHPDLEPKEARPQRYFFYGKQVL